MERKVSPKSPYLHVSRLPRTTSEPIRLQTARSTAEENAPQGAADDAWPKPPANPSRGYDASPAGKGHELSKERFRTKRVRARVDGRRRTIKLRMKLPEPKRLRDTRDGSYLGRVK